MTQANHHTTTASTDARLVALLAGTREAEADLSTACRHEDATGIECAEARLEELLEEMSATPAESWAGVAVKAARICRSLSEDAGGGTTISHADAPLAKSLAADLARLAPEARA